MNDIKFSAREILTTTGGYRCNDSENLISDMINYLKSLSDTSIRPYTDTSFLTYHYLYKYPLRPGQDILSFGKGVDKTASMLSCLGEAIERLSLVKEINKNDKFSLYELTESELSFKCLAPINTAIDDLLWFNSNGAASGKFYEDALVQGMFEILERDIVNSWWFFEGDFKNINLRDIQNFYIHLFIKKAKLKGFKLKTVSITNKYGIPCVASLAFSDQQEAFFIGFGCHVDYNIAIERSITELDQAIVFHQPRRNINDIQFVFKNSGESFSGYKEAKYQSIDQVLSFLVKVLSLHNISMEVFDLTMKNSPLKTIKILSDKLIGINNPLEQLSLVDETRPKQKKNIFS